MARDFDGVDDHILAGVVSTLDDFTLVAWVRTATSGAIEALCGVVEDGNNEIIQIQFNTDEGENQVDNDTRFQVKSSAANESGAFTNATVYDGEWHHHALRRSGADTAYYIDGTAQTITYLQDNLGATQLTFARPFAIGARNVRGTNGQFANCDVAEWGIYGAALTDAEITALSKRVPLSRIRRGSVEIWYSLFGGSSEPDRSGNGLNGTVTGTTIADHAPVAPPFGFDLGWQGAFTAAAAAANIPAMMHAYRQMRR